MWGVGGWAGGGGGWITTCVKVLKQTFHPAPLSNRNVSKVVGYRPVLAYTHTRAGTYTGEPRRTEVKERGEARCPVTLLGRGESEREGQRGGGGSRLPLQGSHCPPASHAGEGVGGGGAY